MEAAPPETQPIDDGTTSSDGVGPVLTAIAQAVSRVAALVAAPPPQDGSGVLAANASGDTQTPLDVVAHDVFVEVLAAAPVQSVMSEEADAPILLDRTAPYAVAVDPLDGSSNVDVDAPIGAIFSVLPGVDLARSSPDDAFLVDGTQILAAGFALFGPRTVLVVATEDGVRASTLDPTTREFVRSDTLLRVPEQASEYAINASNHRHWQPSVRKYVDDLMAGESGPRGVNFNMRWIAALVAEAYRILIRGGIFLYPADSRPGYEHGRLRLLYEAQPIAYVMERAGGEATDGRDRILDRRVTDLHERCPLVFGSAAKVARVREYDIAAFAGERDALFGRRGLFRS